MRVLSDQIPGLNKMAVFVQTEGQTSQILQGQNFTNLHSNNREQNPRPDTRAKFEWDAPNRAGDMPKLEINATGLHVRI
jgi:N6-adenosine-specific RNA methylase IME4